MNWSTNYLPLKVKGETQQEVPPNTSDDALSQLNHLVTRTEKKINDHQRDSSERLDK